MPNFDVLSQICMAAQQLVQDVAAISAREREEFAAGYHAGYAAGYDIGRAHGIAEENEAWCAHWRPAVAHLQRTRNLPTFAELQRRRYPERTTE